MGQRLAWIHQGIVEVLEAFPPGAVALEQVHSHVNFPRTAILMAHARGVIVLAAAQRADAGLRLRRHPDQEDPHRQRPGPKSQIQHAIMAELGLDRLPEPHDVADACAVALCHFHISRNQRLLQDDLRAVRIQIRLCRPTPPGIRIYRLNARSSWLFRGRRS